MVVAVFVSLYQSIQSSLEPSYLPWHDTPQWERLLRIYDIVATKDLSDCSSRYVATDYGETHVFLCGNNNDHDNSGDENDENNNNDPTTTNTNPPVVFLHQAGYNALQYSDWIVPQLRNSHYCILIDMPCDTGRSLPPNGDPEQCPQTKEALVEWMEQVLTNVLPPATETQQQQQKVSFVGYSYGVFVAVTMALMRPSMVDKMVWIAPSGVIAPCGLSTMVRAVVYALIKNEWMQNNFYRYMSAEGDAFSLDNLSPNLREMTHAIREVDGTLLGVYDPDFLSDEQLRGLSESTLLLVGQHEVLLDPTYATERANQAGMQAKLYPDGGQLMFMETPKAAIANDVKEFLTTATVSTAHIHD